LTPLRWKRTLCDAQWVRNASLRVERVRALGVVELERAGQRLEHVLGDAAHVAALEPRVVRDADAGEYRDLLAPQPGDAAAAVGRQPDLLRRDPRPP
jgi:hypothetical protein